jgi:hypothetical protein
MWAKYVYDSAASAANILDDIYLILGGEETVSNLSVDCNQSSTEIIATTSSPWGQWDDVSTTKKILRCEVSDEPGVYKFVSLNDVSNIYIRLAAMADWVQATDTPTDETALYDKCSMTIDPTNGGTMYLAAQQEFFIMMHVNTSNVWGSTSGDPSYGSIGCFECTRGNPSLATGDMPNWFISGTDTIWGDSDQTSYARFWKGRNNADTVVKPFDAQMARMARDRVYSDTSSYALTGVGGTTALTGIGAPVSFTAETIIVGGSPYDVANLECEVFLGDVSSQCDVWFMPPSTNEVGQTVRIGSNGYFIFKTGYTAGTAGDTYGGKIIVPHG